MEKCCSSEQTEETFLRMFEEFLNFNYYVLEGLLELDWRDLFLGK